MMLQIERTGSMRAMMTSYLGTVAVDVIENVGGVNDNMAGIAHPLRSLTAKREKERQIGLGGECARTG